MIYRYCSNTYVSSQDQTLAYIDFEKLEDKTLDGKEWQGIAGRNGQKLTASMVEYQGKWVIREAPECMHCLDI